MNYSVNGPEVDFAEEIKIEVTNDIAVEADRADGEEELNKNPKDKSLDSETNGFDAHEIDSIPLEIMTDY